MTIHEARIPELYSDDRRRVTPLPENRVGPGGITVDASFRLPPPSRLKLQGLREDFVAAGGRWRALEDRRQQLLETRQVRRDWLNRLVTPRKQEASDGRSGHGLAENDPEVLEIADQVREAELSLEKTAAAANEAASERNEKARLIEALDRYVQRLPRTGVELVEHQPAPEIRKGEIVLDAIGRVRGRLKDLRAKIARIEAAPITSNAAKKLMRDEMAHLIERGRPDLFDLVERGGKIAWPEIDNPGNTPLSDGSRATTRTTTFDALACFAWLNQKALIACLDLEIDRAADDKEALEPDEREKKLAMTRTLALATEYEEEALITLANSDGRFPALRRPDADPRAVLGISDQLPDPEPLFGGA